MHAFVHVCFCACVHGIDFCAYEVIGFRKDDTRRDILANCSASASHDSHRHPPGEHTSLGNEAGKVAAKLSAVHTQHR